MQGERKISKSTLDMRKLRRKKKEDIKDIAIQIRVSENEESELKEKATTARMNLSSYIRWKALTG